MPVQQFLTALTKAFHEGSLHKCTLSKPAADAPADLKNIYIRPVSLKGAVKLSWTYRYKTRDEVKNYDLDSALEQLNSLLGPAFQQAELLSAQRDYTLLFTKSGASKLISRKPSMPALLGAATHNREKKRLLDASAPWLHTLGITNAAGAVLPTAQDKWRQINKFLEIIDGLLKTHPLPNGATIADMGSGKGYLTFALYDYLSHSLGLEVHVTGIELRPALVEFCNKASASAGFTRLDFQATDIHDYNPARLDMMIALHACDTATDLALAKGIQAGADVLVVAPCCHKQIRKEMETRNELAPVLRFGILEERQAEIVTDGIRALLLEANGYKTNVFEFVSTEHTAKNVMITATEVRRSGGGDLQKEKALERVRLLKEGFGIREHYLEKLLQ